MTAVTAAPQAGPQAGPASVAYSGIPYRPRRWLVPGIAAYGEVTVHAAPGETAKGLTWCAIAALVALGLPRPGEDPGTRHAPGLVLWIPSGTEDDQLADLAPRFRAALFAAAVQHGLESPELAVAQGLARIRDLGELADGTPVTLPLSLPQVLAEAALLAPAEGEDGPRVELVVADPLTALLSEGHNVRSVEGARKVMGACIRTARELDAAVVIIHHVTSTGKAAGSPAVTDSVRLAVTTRRDPARPGALVLARYKSNISKAGDLALAVAGDGPDVHAVFVTAPGPDGAGAPEGSLRARIAGAGQESGQEHGKSVPAPAAAPAPRQERSREHAQPPAAARPGDYAGQGARAFTLLRTRGGGQAEVLGRSYPGERAARRAAEDDAAVPALRWHASADDPAITVATALHGGMHSAYAVAAS